ncbi:MAG TPA: alpha/beta fold hydrolase [Chitinophagaceae bacterium]
MKKLFLLVPGFILFIQSFAQPDFKKLQQEYISRKPFLDTMRSYPAVPYDSLKVINEQGVAISFWWMPQEKNKGTVLLVHGFLMNKSHMLTRAKIYYDMGYNVIVMDLRARGQSGGDSATSGPEVRSDVIAVIDHYSDNLMEYGPLVLIGYSHGGRAIVFAAEKKAVNVKAIILESIPYSLTESFKRTFKVEPPPIPEGNIPEAFQAISRIPILLMIGDHDTAIIPEEAGAIKDAYKNSLSQLIIFKGAGHDLAGEKYRSLYTDSIEAFLFSVMK